MQQFIQKCKKNIVILSLLLGIPIISGTYGGTEGGFPPFYNKKVGTSYGINLGINTEFMPDSKFYGISISAFNNNQGTIKGLDLGLANQGNLEGKINGIEIGLINFPGKAVVPNSNLVNGLQLGIINLARSGNLLQIGIYNGIHKNNGEIKRGFPINYAYTQHLK